MARTTAHLDVLLGVEVLLQPLEHGRLARRPYISKPGQLGQRARLHRHGPRSSLADDASQCAPEQPIDMDDGLRCKHAPPRINEVGSAYP